MAQHVMMETVLVRIAEGSRLIDASLPVWARRSNPIVRRQLGIYWKTLPLELGMWLRVLLVEAVIVLAALPLPIIYTFIMPVVTVSVLLVPVVAILYAQLLYHVAVQSTVAIYDEQRNNTLALLLITPQPLHHILFSKVAACIWRQMDNLSLIVATHVLLSLPLLVLQYAGIYNQEEEPLLTAFAIIVAMGAGLVRLLLEPIMVGAIGLLVGSTTSPRILALIVSGTLSAAYFLFINLPRLMPLSWTGRILIEIVLPLVAPLVVTWLAIAGAVFFLRRD